MSFLLVRRGPLQGTVPAPPSKSYTHRAVFLGMLAPRATLHAPLLSDDTLATVRVAHMLGARLQVQRAAGSLDAATLAVPPGKPVPEDLALDPGTLRVEGGELRAPAAKLDCANSGTTIRIATALAGLLGAEVVLDGDESLRTRPMGPLLDALGHVGATARSLRGNGSPPVSVKGPLRGGVAKIRGDVSSQFITGLLLAATRTPQPLTVHLTSPLKSAPYVEVTLAMLAAFGARAERSANEFRVAPAPLRETEYAIPGDWSSAAFPLVAAAVTGGRVTVENLDLEDPQGDRALLAILETFGAKVHAEKEARRVTVEGGPLAAAEVDVGHTPDLFPALAVLAAAAKGTTVLENAEHVRYKESDRVAAMASGLAKMGCVVKEARDALTVQGGRRLVGATIDARGDHRVTMAFAVAGLVAQGETRVSHAESCAVSYPAFVGHMRRLGAPFEIAAAKEARA